jgi:hypothetical protein
MARVLRVLLEDGVNVIFTDEFGFNPELTSAFNWTTRGSEDFLYMKSITRSFNVILAFTSAMVLHYVVINDTVKLGEI